MEQGDRECLEVAKLVQGTLLYALIQRHAAAQDEVNQRWMWERKSTHLHPVPEFILYVYLTRQPVPRVDSMEGV